MLITNQHKAMGAGLTATGIGHGKRLAANMFGRLVKTQRGFSLIETMAAIMIVALAVGGTMQVMGATIRSAGRAEGNVKLLQLVRSQVEDIKQAPFRVNANYDIIPDLPEGITMAIDASDIGAVYFYPAPVSSKIEKVIQEITVTAAQGEVDTTLTFYKLDTR